MLIDGWRYAVFQRAIKELNIRLKESGNKGLKKNLIGCFFPLNIKHCGAFNLRLKFIYERKK
jgi:hypothetical protein